MRFILSTMAVFAVALGVLTGCQNANLSSKNEPIKPTNTNSVVVQKTVEPKPLDDAPRITLADAKKDFDAGNVVFVDTRAEVQYKQDHIKGAINVPAEAMETRYKEIPTGKKIIAYCS